MGKPEKAYQKLAIGFIFRAESVQCIHKLVPAKLRQPRFITNLIDFNAGCLWQKVSWRYLGKDRWTNLFFGHYIDITILLYFELVIDYLI